MKDLEEWTALAEKVAIEAREALQQFGICASAREINLERRGLSPSAGCCLGALLKRRAMALPNEDCALSFEAMRLRTNGLGTDGVRSMCEGFDARFFSKRRTTLTELDLAENSLGARGVAALCDALKDTGYDGLKRLDLSGNRCGPIGATKVCNTLLTLSRLRHLKFAHNTIADTGVGEFGRKAFGGLVLLDIRSNDISATGAIALTTGLVNNTSLTALDLRANLISLEGFWAIGDAIRKHHRASIYFYGLPVQPKPLYNRLFGPPNCFQLRTFRSCVASNLNDISQSSS